MGPVNWSNGPVRNASATPLVGGQWVRGGDWPFDLAICENTTGPEIPVTSAFMPL